jgi:hypothetical protein
MLLAQPFPFNNYYFSSTASLENQPEAVCRSARSRTLPLGGIMGRHRYGEPGDVDPYMMHAPRRTPSTLKLSYYSLHSTLEGPGYNSR